MTQRPPASPSPYLLLCLLLSGACGDDGSPSSGDAGAADTAIAMDTGRPRSCPMGPTPLAEQQAPCCYHASNADRLDAPQFRVAAMDFTAPASLANLFIASLLGNAIDQERFNWVFALSDAAADGPISIRTGGAARQDDGTFTFANGDAPGPAGAARWDPITFPGAIAGDTWSNSEPTGMFILPVAGEEPGTLAVELPFRNLLVDMAVMTADRSCIGERFVSSYDTGQGSLRAFMTVEAAMASPVILGADNTSTLCSVVASLLTRPEGCALPRTEWGSAPDAFCDADGCTTNAAGMTDVCDPLTDCNAWASQIDFAAHGVDVR